MTKKLFILYRRCHRIYKRLEENRGYQINWEWYEWMNKLLCVFDELKTHGVVVDTSPYLDQTYQTQESKLILQTFHKN